MMDDGEMPDGPPRPRRLVHSVWPKTRGRDTVPWTDDWYPEDDDDDPERAR